MVEKCMRPSVLLVCCACAGAPPAPLQHADNWAHGRPVHVADLTCEVASLMCSADSRNGQAAHKAAEEELASLGFTPTSQVGEGIVMVEFAHVARAAMRATFRDGGAVIGRFEADVDRDHLRCYSTTWGEYFSDNYHCMIREILRKAIASPAFAARIQSPAPPGQQAATSSTHRWRGTLAVLDLRAYTKEVTPDQARYFTDLVRSATLRAAPGLEVMTRENVLVLLKASGKSLEDCEGECEVDTGRRLGADLIVTGEIQSIGKRLKIALRLHDTREGRLLSSTIASGNSMEELDDATNKAVADLYR